MDLNVFCQAKSEFSHVVQMVRNHIAEENFISKFILSVSNSHERLGEAMDRFDVKCQICRHSSSPCFKAVRASPKLNSITHKSMCSAHFQIKSNSFILPLVVVIYNLSSSWYSFNVYSPWLDQDIPFCWLWWALYLTHSLASNTNSPKMDDAILESYFMNVDPAIFINRGLQPYILYYMWSWHVWW